ncbi:hypothetical protein O3M35_001022 [Rhynocoris fuscipes]|uniref:Uncharacterized protein n=1 Tax=Rhynocoris fuscipes TaxID=488301 RepID=A0AAW1DRC9_9HEMI
MKSADLQRAREHANAAANTAHTAIASLSAHDQLMNRARQIINGLTAQLVAIQRELLVAQQNYIFNGTDQPPVSEEGNSLYLPPIKTATDYRSNLFDNNYLNIDNDLSRSIMQPVENNFVLPAFKETNFNLEQLQNIAGEHSEPLIVLNPTNNNLPRSYIPGNSDLYWLSQYRAPKGWYF